MHVRESLQDESEIEIRFKVCFMSDTKWEPDTGIKLSDTKLL